MRRRTTGIVIVGAGFTGLAAAVALKRAGVDCVVLEARERPGGRVEAVTNGLGERIDTGGQFLCDDMPELMKLVRAGGMTLIETPVEGLLTAQPAASQAEVERTYAAGVALRDRMNAVDTSDLSIAGLTVAGWLARQSATGEAKAAFQSMIEGLWCQSIDDMSLWYLIDNDRRITNEVGELQYFVRETLQALAEDMASELRGRLRLASPVTAIETHESSVSVTSGNEIWEADRVIIAVPPVMARRIHITPHLPVALERALDAWRSGMVIKALVRYREPFWRRSGLNGMVMWRDVHGLFACDASPDDAHPALVVFIAGPLARAWRTEGALSTQITERLAAALGPEARDMLDMNLRDWCDDPWSGGGYSDVIVDPEAVDAEDILRRGTDRVLFASSELSPSFPGYVEGAIVAGRLAAGRAMRPSAS